MKSGQLFRVKTNDGIDNLFVYLGYKEVPSMKNSWKIIKMYEVFSLRKQQTFRFSCTPKVFFGKYYNEL